VFDIMGRGLANRRLTTLTGDPVDLTALATALARQPLLSTLGPEVVA